MNVLTHGGEYVRQSEVTTTTVAVVNSNKHKNKKLYVLLDTGSRSSFLSSRFKNKCSGIKKCRKSYNSAGGTFSTNSKGALEFKLPEFSTSKKIMWQDFIIDNGELDKLGYDMIVGRDLMLALGMIIDFKYQVTRWDNIGIPMNRKITNKKELNAFFEKSMESTVVKEATNRVTRIIDATYERVDLH